MEKILKMIENNPSIISTIENPTDENDAQLQKAIEIILK